MGRFSFALNPVARLPWEVLMYLCAMGAFAGAIFRNIHAVLSSLVGALICFLFFCMKRCSYILVTDRTIKVRMGVFAYGEMAFSNIAGVETVTHKAIHGIGVKACGKGEMAMVTTAGEVARLVLREKETLRMFGFIKMSFTALRLSPESKDEFITMVKERIGTGNKSQYAR
jgi:hypothetical protein